MGCFPGVGFHPLVPVKGTHHASADRHTLDTFIFVGILWGWPLLVPDRSTWSQITPEQVTVSVNSPWSRAPRSTFCLFPPPSYRNASSSARRNSSGWAPGPPCCRTRKQLPSGARWSVGNTTEEGTPRGLLRKNMTAV